MTAPGQPRDEGAIEPLAEPVLPLVTVLLPVRNEAGFIDPCLRALAAQDYPRDRFEVILLDGESSDTTVQEVEALQAELSLPDKVINNPRRTTATAMNLGIWIARGEIVIKVDGHTRVAPDFISASVLALRQSGADAAGGPIRTVGQEDAIGSAIALAMSSPFGVGDTAFRHSQSEQWTDSVPFGAYRREVFQRVGLFAEDIERGEDDEFNYRLRDSGGRILLTPTIRSEYYSRSTYAALARQYWNYGLAKVAVLERHPRRLRARHLVPSAFVLTLAGGVLLSVFDRRFGRLASLAATTYAVANTIASLRLAARGHRRELPYLPGAFATIHLAAGSGMIAGALRILRSKLRRRVG
ncbi:MAG: glycosyltransferase [Dehalococcoidia bacterium]|nr:glycosyltransferase [Dehalococcoidia bacterium]